MRSLWICSLIVGLVIGGTTPAKAVTVYLKDGTRLDVEKVTRVGNTVWLFLDLSKIDTTRTTIEEVSGEVKTPQEGLAVVNVDFSPSDDNTEIIGTGKVVNHTPHSVKNVQVTAVLMDKNEKVLLRVRGHVQPEVLSPGQTGEYLFRVKKPQGFWKASVEVQGDTVQQSE